MTPGKASGPTVTAASGAGPFTYTFKGVKNSGSISRNLRHGYFYFRGLVTFRFSETIFALGNFELSLGRTGVVHAYGGELNPGGVGFNHPKAFTFDGRRVRVTRSGHTIRISNIVLRLYRNDAGFPKHDWPIGSGPDRLPPALGSFAITLKVGNLVKP